jgi:hypothetical protein
MKPMRERIAKAIGMAECSDGDPLGVALAENFCIENGCESAAEVLLLRAADAVLAELMSPTEEIIEDMLRRYYLDADWEIRRGKYGAECDRSCMRAAFNMAFGKEMNRDHDA